MLDFKNVKKIVVDELCKDPQSGYELENARKLVANIIKAIEDEKYHLQILNYEINDDRDVAKVIVNIIREPNIGRCFLSNLEKSNYDNKDILIQSINEEILLNSIEPFYKLASLNINPFIDISKIQEDMYKKFSDYASYQQKENFMDINDLVRGSMRVLSETLETIREKRLELFDNYIDGYCIEHTLAYINLCFYVITALIRTVIIDNINIDDEYKAVILIHLCNMLDYRVFSIDEKYKNDDRKYIGVRNESLGYADNSDILYATLFYSLITRSRFHELNVIYDVLINEWDNGDYPQLDQSILYALWEADEIESHRILLDEARRILKKKKSDNENDVCKDEKQKNTIRETWVKKNISEIKSTLNEITKLSNIWINTEDSIQMAVAFVEIYLSKSKYNGHMARTIVRNALNKNTDRVNCTSDLLFIDSKLVRGHFFIKGMYDEYKEFIKINKKLGELFLKCYDVLYEVNQCEIAYLISDHIVMCMNDVLNSFFELYERYTSQPQ